MNQNIANDLLRNDGIAFGRSRSLGVARTNPKIAKCLLEEPVNGRDGGRIDVRDCGFEALTAQRVLVKNVSTMHPLLAQCLRLTVGTPDENAQLLRALQTAL